MNARRAMPPCPKCGQTSTTEKEWFCCATCGIEFQLPRDGFVGSWPSVNPPTDISKEWQHLGELAKWQKDHPRRRLCNGESKGTIRGAMASTAPKTYYWACQCHACRYMIAFAPVGFDHEGKTISLTLPKDAVLEQDCPQCHSPGAYRVLELSPFLGPAVLGFRRHPAFQ